MDRRSTTLPGTIRRRKRGRRATPRRPNLAKLVMGLLVLAMGLTWTLGILFFSLSMNVGQHRQTVETREEPPPHFLNAWPDDAAEDLVPGFLQECLPPACVATRAVNKYENVLVVRPPGPLGDILAAFVYKYLEDSTLQITVTTAPLHAPFPATTDYDALIHLVTLPLLCEALDLLLLAATPTQALLTPADVVAVVEHLLQWHCRVAAHAHEVATVVLTLDPTLSFPLRSEAHLHFLLNDDGKDADEIPVSRQELAQQTMAQVDRGTAFWEGLLLPQQSSSSSSLRAKAASANLPQRVDTLIQRLLPDGHCPAVFPAATRGWFAAASPVESLLESLWVDALEERSDEN